MRRILAAARLVAAAALMTGCAGTTAPPVSDKVQEYYDENVKSATVSASTSALASDSVVVVSVLSDSHTFNSESWFRRTVEAGRVPDVRVGAFVSQPGASATILTDKLVEATKAKGIVIVQAGTNDLLSAVSPMDTAENVEALIARVKKRGVQAIVAMLPPSANRPAEVLETNDLLTAYAKENKVGVLDLTTPVIAADGRWKEGSSGDGRRANAAGSKLMADAIAKQIAKIVR